MAQFNASLFGPFEPGRSRPVKVEVGEDGFVFLVPGGACFELPAAAAKLSRGGFDGKAVIIDGAPVEGPQLHAVITDPAFPRAVASQGPASLRRALEPPPERWFWEDFSFSLDWAARHKAVTIPGGLLCAWLIFTLMVEAIVAFMPTRWETALGQMAVQSLIHGERVLKDGPAVEVVGTVWSRVQKGIPTNPFTWQVFVVDSPTVNALAAPGGQIVVYTGLLKTMKTPEELAGVLGHEVTHAVHRHGIRGMVRASLLAIIISLTVGDGGALTGIVRDFGQEIAARSFSRSQEREADRGAVEIMRRASIDPSGLSVFLGRLAAKEGQFGPVLGLLSTHPPSTERMAFLKEITGAGDKTFEPLGVSLSVLHDEGAAASSPGKLKPRPQAEQMPRPPLAAGKPPRPAPRPAATSRPTPTKPVTPSAGQPSRNR